MAKGYFLYVKESNYTEAVINDFIKQYDSNYQRKNNCWDRVTTVGVVYFEFSTAKDRANFMKDVIGIKFETIEDK